MYRVKVVWLTENEGGRRSAPPIGRYYPVSRFPEEKTDWQNNAWSVVFELEKPNVTDDVSFQWGAFSSFSIPPLNNG